MSVRARRFLHSMNIKKNTETKRVIINLPVAYQKCCNLIGYATLCLSSDS